MSQTLPRAPQIGFITPRGRDVLLNPDTATFYNPGECAKKTMPICPAANSIPGPAETFLVAGDLSRCEQCDLLDPLAESADEIGSKKKSSGLYTVSKSVLLTLGYIVSLRHL